MYLDCLTKSIPGFINPNLPFPSVKMGVIVKYLTSLSMNTYHLHPIMKELMAIYFKFKCDGHSMCSTSAGGPNPLSNSSLYGSGGAMACYKFGARFGSYSLFSCLEVLEIIVIAVIYIMRQLKRSDSDTDQPPSDTFVLTKLTLHLNHLALTACYPVWKGWKPKLLL